MARRKRDEVSPEANGTVAVEAPAEEHPPLEEKNQPVHVVRIRSVRAAVWANARPDSSVWYSVTFSRSYRDGEGGWHTSESFGANDLLMLSEASRQAFMWIIATTQGETPF